MNLQQLGPDLLFKIIADDLQLAGVLQHFPGDIQADVLGVYHAGDEPEPLGQQLFALVHDEHAAGIKLQAALIVPGIQVKGGMGWDEQQRLVGDSALHIGGDIAQRLLIITELALVELRGRLRGDLVFGPLPQGDHAVQGLDLGIGLPAALPVVAGVGGLFRLTGLFHSHLDGEAHIVGVFFHQALQGVLAEELVIVLALGVLLDVQHDLGAGRFLGALGDGIAVRAGGLPLPGLVAAIGPGGDGDLIRHHKGGVEAHAELADNVHIALFTLFFRQLLLELQRAALCDGAKVALQLLPGHADAVVLDGEGASVLVRRQPDGEVAPAETHLVIGQGSIGQLVDGVAGVGDQLPEKDLLMGVDGVDHHVQQTFGFRFELFLCHVVRFLYFKLLSFAF